MASFVPAVLVSALGKIPHSPADAPVEATLANAVKKSTVQIDGGAKKLKAALAWAQAGMGG